MVSGFFSATAVILTSQCGCPPQQQCTEGVKRLHWRLITFRTLLHLGPNVITFRTLLHLGQLLHLGLQQGCAARFPKPLPYL